MYFTVFDDASPNLLALSPIFRSLMLNSNKKVTNWISTGKTSEKTKPFDTNPEWTVSNLSNGRVIFKFVKPVFVQKNFSSLYSRFILNVYKVF